MGKELRSKGLNPRANGTNTRAMSKKKKSVTAGKSEEKCPQCQGEMFIKKHPQITEKLRNQYYYFTQWDYCTKCKKVFFADEFKVTNGRGADLEERERQRSFISSL